MGKHFNKDEANRRPNSGRGERPANEGTRFRGDLDRDRTDGGFQPVDPQDDYRSREERDRDAGRAQGGQANDESGRWGESRSRWNEGTERGAGFGRNRPVNTGQNFGREYGDPDYGRGYYGGERDMEQGNWERPFERHPGEYQSQRLRGQSQAQAERHPREHHPEYHAWREDQLRRMDEEYDEYRRHRQSEFHTHFEQWRRNKLTGTDAGHGAYAGQNDKIGATPVEFGGQNATHKAFTHTDDEE